MKHAPLIYQYLKKFQDDPTSRVFAPLSEAYRKSGLLQEAIEIAREGVSHHPHFIGGRVALARALFEAGQFEEVASQLAELVQDAPDNIVAQKLLAESCIQLGRTSEALNAYKMLLYFRPEDEGFAKAVQDLEERAYRDGVVTLSSEAAPEAQNFEIKSAPHALAEDPNLKILKWKRRVDFFEKLLSNVERYKLRNASSVDTPSLIG